MAISRITLKQLDPEVLDYFDNLITRRFTFSVTDLTRLHEIAFTSTRSDEHFEKIKEAAPVNRFRVMDLDDKTVLGYRGSMKEAIELFRTAHPYFDDESAKTFIYDN